MKNDFPTFIGYTQNNLSVPVMRCSMPNAVITKMKTNVNFINCIRYLKSLNNEAIINMYIINADKAKIENRDDPACIEPIALKG